MLRRLFSRAPLTVRNFPLPVRRVFGHSNRLRPEGNRPVMLRLALQISFTRTRRHDLAAMNAGARADIDDIVRAAHGVLVVLDHDDGIAEIPQILQRTQ